MYGSNYNAEKVTPESWKIVISAPVRLRMSGEEKKIIKK